MLHDLPSPNCCRLIYKLIYAIIMGRVFHKTFVSFITFEVYMYIVVHVHVHRFQLALLERGVVKTPSDVKPMLR